MSRSSAVGMAGPAPSVATYAASALISSGVYCGSRRTACAPGWASGIRPVPTWKLTAAAPTPMRDGP